MGETGERGLEKKGGEVAAGDVERVYAEPVGRSIGRPTDWAVATMRLADLARGGRKPQPSALKRQGPRASGPFALHLTLGHARTQHDAAVAHHSTSSA